MHRVLIPPQAGHAEQVTITDPNRVHHLRHVLRVRVGERLECFDGKGHRFSGPVTLCTSRQVTVNIDQQADDPPPRVGLTLAQSLIKLERFEWVIQKATELGVAEIIPVLTSRTTVQPRVTDGTHRLERWRRIAEEAAAQCGRATVPAIRGLQPFDQLLGTLEDRAALLLTLAEPAPPLLQCVGDLNDTRTIAVMIGPEGDFSPEEVALARQRGVRLARLGRATLRSETAALAALVILQHRLEML